MTVTVVKGEDAIPDDVSSTRTERASKRYVKLIKELGREREFKHGWKSDVARLLGVDASYISRLARDERVGCGQDAIQSAVQALRLSLDYFYGQIEPATYRAFVEGKSVRHPGLVEFERTDPLGASLTDQERRLLESIRFDGYEQPDAHAFGGLLIAMRGRLKVSTEDIKANSDRHRALTKELSDGGGQTISRRPRKT